MAMMNQVVWQEGMLLTPQHFQMQQDCDRTHLQDFIKNYLPYPYWGIVEMSLDTAALPQNEIRVGPFLAVLPSGRAVQISADQALTCEITHHQSPAFLNLQVDPYDMHHYQYHSQEIVDKFTPYAELRSIQLAKLNGKLALSSQPTNEINALTLAKLVSDQTSTWQLDCSFVPCMLDIRGSQELMRLADSYRLLLSSELAKLTQTLTALPLTACLELPMVEYVLRQGLLESELMLQMIHLHPWYLYKTMLQCYYHLSSATAPQAKHVPHYHHRQSYQVLQTLLQAIKQSLERATHKNYHNLPRHSIDEHTSQFNLTSEALGGQNKLGLRIRRDAVATATDVRKQIKLMDEASFMACIRYSLRGCELIELEAPADSSEEETNSLHLCPVETDPTYQRIISDKKLFVYSTFSVDAIECFVYQETL